VRNQTVLGLAGNVITNNISIYNALNSREAFGVRKGSCAFLGDVKEEECFKKEALRSWSFPE